MLALINYKCKIALVKYCYLYIIRVTRYIFLKDKNISLKGEFYEAYISYRWNSIC